MSAERKSRRERKEGNVRILGIGEIVNFVCSFAVLYSMFYTIIYPFFFFCFVGVFYRMPWWHCLGDSIVLIQVAWCVLTFTTCILILH